MVIVMAFLTFSVLFFSTCTFVKRKTLLYYFPVCQQASMFQIQKIASLNHPP